MASTKGQSDGAVQPPAAAAAAAPAPATPAPAPPPPSSRPPAPPASGSAAQPQQTSAASINNWLFTAEELEQCPSVAAGYTRADLDRRLRAGCTYQRAIAKALELYGVKCA